MSKWLPQTGAITWRQIDAERFEAVAGPLLLTIYDCRSPVQRADEYGWEGWSFFVEHGWETYAPKPRESYMGILYAQRRALEYARHKLMRGGMPTDPQLDTMLAEAHAAVDAQL